MKKKIKIYNIKTKIMLCEFYNIKIWDFCMQTILSYLKFIIFF